MRRPIEQRRFVLQRNPDASVEPCLCGSPFGILRIVGQVSLSCGSCGAALDPSIARHHDLDSDRRSPGHEQCSRHRIVVPKVGDEVDAAWVLKNGAARWDLFCVDCGEKDGSVQKNVLLGGRRVVRRDDNAFQRTDVLERAGRRCELCCAEGVPLHVGHCLSVKDANALSVPSTVRESLWNKCALCEACNVANMGGYGENSMSPSTYCNLTHTRAESRKMLDFGAKGPEPIDPEFYRIYGLLRERLLKCRKDAA